MSKTATTHSIAQYSINNNLTHYYFHFIRFQYLIHKDTYLHRCWILFHSLASDSIISKYTYTLSHSIDRISVSNNFSRIPNFPFAFTSFTKHFRFKFFFLSFFLLSFLLQFVTHTNPSLSFSAELCLRKIIFSFKIYNFWIVIVCHHHRLRNRSFSNWNGEETEKK